jgi:CIC family chloride channel protein
VFGPTLFIGAMLGGVIGYTGHAWAPVFFPHPAAFVLVGMASFFAGVASAPIGAMLMVAEMTGGYALLPALMLVSVLAIALQRGHSIYRAQVKDRFRSPAHSGNLVMNVLEEMRVADVLGAEGNVSTIAPSTSFASVRQLLLASPHATLPVRDADGRIVGLLTAEHLRKVMGDHHLDQLVVASDVCTQPVWLYPDDDLARAQQLFRMSGCPQVPVLESNGEDNALIGMLDYLDLMRAYEQEIARRRAG